MSIVPDELMVLTLTIARNVCENDLKVAFDQFEIGKQNGDSTDKINKLDANLTQMQTKFDNIQKLTAFYNSHKRSLSTQRKKDIHTCCVALIREGPENGTDYAYENDHQLMIIEKSLKNLVESLTLESQQHESKFKHNTHEEDRIEDYDDA